MGDTNFKIDSADYLGIENESFKQRMLELAISKPKDYFLIRRTVLAAVKKVAVQNQYNVYYHLLSTLSLPLDDGSKGLLVINKCPEAMAVFEEKKDFQPCVPKQVVNEFALAAAKTIDAIAEKAIELILPSSFASLASDRETKKTAGDLFQTA